jgi:hypothetical protein
MGKSLRTHILALFSPEGAPLCSCSHTRSVSIHCLDSLMLAAVHHEAHCPEGLGARVPHWQPFSCHLNIVAAHQLIGCGSQEVGIKHDCSLIRAELQASRSQMSQACDRQKKPRAGLRKADGLRAVIPMRHSLEDEAQKRNRTAT